jgi:hypothetical protein
MVGWCSGGPHQPDARRIIKPGDQKPDAAAARGECETALKRADNRSAVSRSHQMVGVHHRMAAKEKRREAKGVNQKTSRQ